MYGVIDGNRVPTSGKYYKYYDKNNWSVDSLLVPCLIVVYALVRVTCVHDDKTSAIIDFLKWRAID